METLPDQFSYLALAVLALVDSTSIGTLVVPVLLLVTAGASMCPGRIAVRTLYYLLVIGVFYFVLGVALTAGALPLFERFGNALGSTPALFVYVVIGVALFLWSFYVDPKAIRKRGGDPEERGRRWIARARDAVGSFRTLTGLALLAGVIEAASMLPYLAAIGIIVDSGAGIRRAALVLVAYCAVMCLPGIVLALGRGLIGTRLDGLLGRVQDWSIRNAAGAFSWTIGIVGALVVLYTAPELLQNLGIAD